MNNIREMDPLRRENWQELCAAVPDCVNDGVALAFARIRRREQRRRRILQMTSVAACAALVLGACTLALTSRKPADSPDHVAASPAETLVLHAGDIVYASNDDPCFHAYSSCSRLESNAVELPLVTALEFQKTLCGLCGANVELDP